MRPLSGARRIRQARTRADRPHPAQPRYRLTVTGLHHAMLLTHGRLLVPVPNSPTPTPRRPARYAPQAATGRLSDQLTQDAGPRRMTPWLDLADFVGLGKPAHQPGRDPRRL